MSDPSPARRVALRLARLSFADGAAAAARLTAPALRWWDEAANAPVDDRAAAVVAALGRCADPDAALATLALLLETEGGPALRAALESSSALRARLFGVLGVSRTLGEHLVAHPEHWRVLLDEPRANELDSASIDGLRSSYRRELLAIAGRDLAEDLPISGVMAELAELAGRTLQAALDLATRAEPAAQSCRLAVIAMGKTGGGELNYVSDVDVVFVAEARPEGGDVAGDGMQTAARLAGELMRICREVAWEVDAGLRPEGKNGELVRTVASHEAYYRRWASTWEFQALLKARPIAGDAELGQQYLDAVRPMVWQASERPDFVADVRAMRLRVLAHLPPEVADREIKLGRGGLRDVEFAVQLLQLVHGRGDDTLHVPDTLGALAALRDGGYVGRDDAQSLADAYRFLRATEHRLQLRRLRRTHLLPEDPDELSWLAKALGYRPDARGDARAVFEAEWSLHSREVRRLHEKLFYRPLLEAVARVPTEGLRLSTAAARARLAALGFGDPDAALRHIEALTAGLSRRAVLQRALLPVLLADFADAPEPDIGLLAYRRVSEELGETPWYLRLLRDEGAVASRLAYLLGTSRYVGRMVERAPEALQLLADDAELVPRTHADIAAEMSESAHRQRDAAAAVAVVRGVRRQELLRIAFADLLGRLDVAGVGDALSSTMEATLEAALEIAVRDVGRERSLPPGGLGIRLAVIAMGRLGGAEISYGSDADVMFVFSEAEGGASGDNGDSRDSTALAQAVAERVRSLLGSPSSSDPPLGIDADLRPEGRNGPLARSLESYEHYYARWSSAWEAQALLRARFAAGDAELGARFIDMIDPVRYPATGVSASEEVEIRRLKARIDNERLPRGADPATHTKLGRGGLTDVEWTIQLLQLRHGHAVSGLRTPRTLDALAAAAAAGLLSSQQADTLAAAWQLATRIRNGLMLARDKATDQLPQQGTALIALGRALGYPAGFEPGQLVDDWRRAARRARRVVDEIFYP